MGSLRRAMSSEATTTEGGPQLAKRDRMSPEHSGPSRADHLGQAAGGISGVVAGAALGATAGPIGVLLGGIAGAIGGWWSGRAIAEAAEDITDADEQYYRRDYERGDRRVNHASRARFDAARQAYLLGDVAAANPAYVGREFAEIEEELARGWSVVAHVGDWAAMRAYAAVGFQRGRARRAAMR